MITFEQARQIAAEHYGEPFARKGLQDQTACLVTPQRIVDDEARGLVLVGGSWIVVDRETREIQEWPHLENLDRVGQMRSVRGS